MGRASSGVLLALGAPQRHEQEEWLKSKKEDVQEQQAFTTSQYNSLPPPSCQFNDRMIFKLLLIISIITTYIHNIYIFNMTESTTFSPPLHIFQR